MPYKTEMPPFRKIALGPEGGGVSSESGDASCRSDVFPREAEMPHATPQQNSEVCSLISALVLDSRLEGTVPRESWTGQSVGIFSLCFSVGKKARFFPTDGHGAYPPPAS